MHKQYSEELNKEGFKVKIIALLLKTIIAADNSQIHEQTPFDLRGNAQVDLQEYIKRINKYMHCSKSCILMALILIDRLQDENEDFRLTSKNIYKVFMVAIVIAAKIHDDAVYKNTYYSQISGFSAKQLNVLERKFLQMISFKSYINPRTYQKYKEKVQRYQQSYIEAKQTRVTDTSSIEQIQNKEPVPNIKQ